MKYNKSLCWIRRDLRLHDHKSLSEACAQSEEVALVFVFDKSILEKLKNQSDQRVSFIYESLAEMNEKLKSKNSHLLVLHGDPKEEIPQLAKKLKVDAVFTNDDYEAYAKSRDRAVSKSLSDLGVNFHSFKDQVILQGDENLKKDGTPYQVFTPYMRAWRSKVRKENFTEAKVNLNKLKDVSWIKGTAELKKIESYGFKYKEPSLKPGASSASKSLKSFLEKINNYKKDRDFPAVAGTSLLSVHLRFGTLSIREVMRAAFSKNSEGARTWQDELIWREFYFMILNQFPHVEKKAFKEKYADIKWTGKPAHFKAWCEGKTGFPIVDAAMRQLNETGLMHNRLRMIVASFLVKDLLIDWRKGEAYFAEKLLDFDLSANNGGWQWCASTGCDAQPYFRIFNPESQMKKFDAKNEYIKVWAPEYLSDNPPKPIVDHKIQRGLALALYKEVQ